MEHIGVHSVPIITLSSLAIGMIFALQMVSLLEPFRAEIATGSAMAAEIGTVKVTERSTPWRPCRWIASTTSWCLVWLHRW